MRLLVVAPLQTHFVNTAGQSEIHADERTMKAAMRSKLLRLLVTVFSPQTPQLGSCFRDDSAIGVRGRWKYLVSRLLRPLLSILYRGFSSHHDFKMIQPFQSPALAISTPDTEISILGQRNKRHVSHNVAEQA